MAALATTLITRFNTKPYVLNVNSEIPQKVMDPNVRLPPSSLYTKRLLLFNPIIPLLIKSSTISHSEAEAWARLQQSSLIDLMSGDRGVSQARQEREREISDQIRIQLIRHPFAPLGPYMLLSFLYSLLIARVIRTNKSVESSQVKSHCALWHIGQKTGNFFFTTALKTIHFIKDKVSRLQRLGSRKLTWEWE